jgi:hypothetical protein
MARRVFVGTLILMACLAAHALADGCAGAKITACMCDDEIIVTFGIDSGQGEVTGTASYTSGGATVSTSAGGVNGGTTGQLGVTPPIGARVDAAIRRRAIRLPRREDIQ